MNHVESVIDGKTVCKEKMLGKSCEKDDQCKALDKFSECNEKVCKCSKLFTDIENTCRSMVAKKEKDYCKATENCPENEECLASKCVCKENFVATSKEVINEKSKGCC